MTTKYQPKQYNLSTISYEELAKLMMQFQVTTFKSLGDLFGVTKQCVEQKLKANKNLPKGAFATIKQAVKDYNIEKQYQIVDHKDEVWCKVEGTKFNVSNYGRVSYDKVVKGVPIKVIKTYSDNSEYLRFSGHTIHQCVAEYFVDGWFEGACVNHKDGDKHNNHWENLEWVTYQENTLHAIHVLKRHGSLSNKGRKGVGCKPKGFKFISPEGALVEGVNLLAFCKEHGLTQSAMARVLHGKALMHKGWTKAQ